MNSHYYFYNGSTIVSDLSQATCHSLLRYQLAVFAEVNRTPQQKKKFVLTGIDQFDSVIATAHEALPQAITYTSYGYAPSSATALHATGYTGQGRDALTQLYILGNGYRAYSPCLRRFYSPDSISPFGAGGINTYAYCMGDPINYTDQSGHGKVRKGKSTSKTEPAPRPASPALNSKYNIDFEIIGEVLFGHKEGLTNIETNGIVKRASIEEVKTAFAGVQVYTTDTSINRQHRTDLSREHVETLKQIKESKNTPRKRDRIRWLDARILDLDTMNALKLEMDATEATVISSRMSEIAAALRRKPKARKP